MYPQFPSLDDPFRSLARGRRCPLRSHRQPNSALGVWRYFLGAARAHESTRGRDSNQHRRHFYLQRRYLYRELPMEYEFQSGLPASLSQWGKRRPPLAGTTAPLQQRSLYGSCPISIDGKWPSGFHRSRSHSFTGHQFRSKLFAMDGRSTSPLHGADAFGPWISGRRGLPLSFCVSSSEHLSRQIKTRPPA